MTGHPWVWGGIGSYGPYGIQAALDHEWLDASSGNLALAVDRLDLTNWLNYKSDRMANPACVPMAYHVSLEQTPSAVWQQIATSGNRTWIAGNEPEISNQGNNTPAQAKAWLQQFYAANPSARVIFGNVLWSSEGRAWLNRFLALNPPAPTYWGIHIHFVDDYLELSQRIEEVIAWINGLPSAYRKAWFLTEFSIRNHNAPNDYMLRYDAMVHVARRMVKQPNIHLAPNLRGAYWYCAKVNNAPNFAQWRYSNLIWQLGDTTDRSPLDDSLTYTGWLFVALRNYPDPLTQGYLVPNGWP